MPLSRNTDHCFRAPDLAGALHHHRVNSRRARTSKTRSSPHILTQLLRTPASSCQHQMGWPMGRKDKENKQKRVVRERPKSTNPAHGLIYRPPARSRSWPPMLWGHHIDHHSVSPVAVDGAKSPDDDCPCELTIHAGPKTVPV